MFCRNCGSQIDDRAVVCPHCGVPTGNAVPNNNVPQGAPVPQQRQDNTIAIVGFVLSFFIALAGLICSIIGYKNSKNGAPYGGLALAGIIISIASMVISVIVVIIVFATLFAVIGAVGTYPYPYPY